LPVGGVGVASDGSCVGAAAAPPRSAASLLAMDAGAPETVISMDAVWEAVARQGGGCSPLGRGRGGSDLDSPKEMLRVENLNLVAQCEKLHGQVNELMEHLRAAKATDSEANSRFHFESVAAVQDQEQLELVQAEIRDLRRQMADRPVASMDASQDVRETEEYRQLQGEVQELRTALERERQQQQAEPQLEHELAALRAELAARPPQEALAEERRRLEGELREQPGLRAEIQRLQLELESRPTAQEHLGLLEEVAALQEQVAASLAQAGNRRARDADLEAARSELAEAEGQVEQLRARSSHLATELASEGAKWIGELASAHGAEAKLREDLRRAQEEIQRLKAEREVRMTTTAPTTFVATLGDGTAVAAPAEGAPADGGGGSGAARTPASSSSFTGSPSLRGRTIPAPKPAHGQAQQQQLQPHPHPQLQLQPQPLPLSQPQLQLQPKPQPALLQGVLLTPRGSLPAAAATFQQHQGHLLFHQPLAARGMQPQPLPAAAPPVVLRSSSADAGRMRAQPMTPRLEMRGVMPMRAQTPVYGSLHARGRR